MLRADPNCSPIFLPKREFSTHESLNGPPLLAVLSTRKKVTHPRNWNYEERIPEKMHTPLILVNSKQPSKINLKEWITKSINISVLLLYYPYFH